MDEQNFDPLECLFYMPSLAQAKQFFCLLVNFQMLKLYTHFLPLPRLIVFYKASIRHQKSNEFSPIQKNHLSRKISAIGLMFLLIEKSSLYPTSSACILSSQPKYHC